MGQSIMTKTKRTTITCRCNAYKFPHRWKGGKCQADKPVSFYDIGYPGDDFLELERSLTKDGPEFEYDDYLDLYG